MAGLAQGILGAFGLEPEGGGILGRGLQALRDNSNGLLGYADGGFEGLIQGRKADMYAQQLRQQREEKALEQQSTAAMAKAIGRPELAHDPATVRALYVDKFKQREPTEWERLTQGLSPDELQQARRAKLGLVAPAPEFTTIGEDDYGNKRYGWVDKRKGTVSPYQGQPGSQPGIPGDVPGAGSNDAVSLPPPPPGVNPKIWRDEQTKIAANEGKQSEKMRTDLASARRSAENLKSELKTFGDMVRQNGAEMSPTAAKAAMQTTYTNIQMQLKNLYELGAITGPDMQILGQLLENPTADGVWEYAGKAVNRQARTQAQINQMQRIIDNSLAAAERNLGGRSGGQNRATSGSGRMRFDAQGNPL